MSTYTKPSSAMPQRSSPFRRPASPASSPTYSNNRASTPPSTSRASPMTSPSKLKQSYTVSEEEGEGEDEDSVIITTPTKTSTTNQRRHNQESPSSFRRLPQPPLSSSSKPLPIAHSQIPSHGPSAYDSSLSALDPLSQLPPQLLNSLRESFSVLDTNSTGTLTPANVHETLQSLGLDTSTINALFPPGSSSSSLSLPQYLNQLASPLSHLSSQQELLNALSAFDDDDSGQIDVAELMRALVETIPDPGERQLTERDVNLALEGFTGRRILGKNAASIAGVRGVGVPVVKKGNGDVFRYQEFVGSLMGGPAVDSSGQAIRA